MIAGMKLSHTLKVKYINAFCNSQLVVNQFSGEYTARDDQMDAYLKIVKELATQFKEFTLT